MNEKLFLQYMADTQPRCSVRFKKRAWILSRPGKIYERLMFWLIGGALAIQLLEDGLRAIERVMR